jgi:hypothetical protein
MGINDNNNKDLSKGGTELVDRIIRYEDGQMEWSEVVEFFQELISSGFILNLQGHYHRTAQMLLDTGEISYRVNTLH